MSTATELAPHEAQRMAQVVTTPASLLAIAVQKGADVAQLEKLMDLQERWEREQARKAYYAAKARFQGACPEIRRDREVSFGGKGAQYKYATLAGIIAQIREPLSACGLAYRWEIEDTKDTITVTCIVSHVDGHSEHNKMGAGLDDSGAKNEIQQRGSTVTYLQRYTLIGCLGIASANDDDDGKSAGGMNVERLRAHNDAVRNWFETVYVVKTCLGTQEWDRAAEAMAEVPRDDLEALWLAPTKGGIFTTSEREAMKSKEWGDAMRRHLSDDIEEPK